ncbi:hypothetical protein [Cellulomonas sp. FA1]|uniref:hypothetical protein n=1 Tax=Cellulomonas sp. FA1 TaxID=1346710 RepID=UPI00069BABE7|nr:hypothetical protein [Cellulomonas sp. FA1]
MRGRTTVGQAAARYLVQLEQRPASTARAQRWALTDLVAQLGDEPLGQVAQDDRLALWSTSPTGSGREPSAASVRQRATAARGLLRHAVEHAMLDADAADRALAALRRPATPPVVRDHAPARLLLARVGGRRPHGVSWEVWVRFRAHVRVLADTGASERDLARACVADLAADATTLRLVDARHELSDPTRHTIEQWLPVRAALVATLEGSPPPQLWVRAHPSVHPRTGAVAAVGMPITARGLRKAFTEVLAALVGDDPRLATCTVAHVRGLGRGRAAGGDRPRRAPDEV